MSSSTTLLLLSFSWFQSHLPPLSDLDRFPPSQVTCEMVACWSGRVCDLEKRALLLLHRQDEFSRAITEAKRSQEVWSALNSAQDTTWATGCYQRRLFLDSLREVLGEEAYLAGILPW